jgi:hypothetical protein
MVIAAEFGSGASELLEHHEITMMLVGPNSTVVKAIKKALSVQNL